VSRVFSSSFESSIKEFYVNIFGRFFNVMLGRYERMEGKRITAGKNDRRDMWIRFALWGCFVYMDWTHKFTKQEIEQAKNEAIEWRELFED
jgi:hypothetical protein